MAAKKRGTKAKKKSEDKRVADRKVVVICLLCGLFAVAYGVVEGFIFKSSAVITGSSGTYTMDPITSILFILAGLVGIGFAIWCWFNPPKT